MSGTRGKRQRVAPGIFRDHYGFSVRVAVGTGGQKLVRELRFPLTTDLAVLLLRRDQEKAKLREAAARGPVATRGTVAADVPVYLQAAQLSPLRVKERTQQLAWWVAHFGHRSRHTLTWQEIRDALLTLTDAAASTRNKYRTCLSNLYTVLDGKNAPNPVRDVRPFKEPDAERRDQPYELIQVILAKLRDAGRHQKGVKLADTQPSKTKAILRVLAYAPVTPAQLWRLWPADVDFKNEVVYPGGRRKGAGAPAITKPLEPPALDAFRAFDAAGCWGHRPSRSSLRRIFIAARDAALQELRVTRPDLDLSRAATMRPYDLRHSFATMVLKETGSLDITAQMLGHAPGSKMVLRYAQGAVPELLKAAGETIGRAFASIPPYVPPAAEGFPPRLPTSNVAESGNMRYFPTKTRNGDQAGKVGSQPRKVAKTSKIP